MENAAADEIKQQHGVTHIHTCIHSNSRVNRDWAGERNAKNEVYIRGV